MCTPSSAIQRSESNRFSEFAQCDAQVLWFLAWKSCVTCDQRLPIIGSILHWVRAGQAERASSKTILSCICSWRWSMLMLPLGLILPCKLASSWWNIMMRLICNIFHTVDRWFGAIKPKRRGKPQSCSVDSLQNSMLAPCEVPSTCKPTSLSASTGS